MQHLTEISNAGKSTININNEFNYKLVKEHNNGTLIDNCTIPEYQEIHFTNYKLDLSLKNCCCQLKCGTIFEIFNFAYNSLLK